MSGSRADNEVRLLLARFLVRFFSGRVRILERNVEAVAVSPTDRKRRACSPFAGLVLDM